MNQTLPVIELELNSGSFKIKTEEAIYQITVSPDSSLGQAITRIVDHEAAKGAEVDADDSGFREDPFYREMSEDLYAEIGQLARRLALSIKDIPGPNFKTVDLEKTGIELEGAKEQLEDIVQMTEKATMEIMDLAEAMSEDCQKVQETLNTIKNLEILKPAEDELDWGDETPSEKKEESTGTGSEALADLLKNEQSLMEMIRALPVSEGEAKTADPAATQPDEPAPGVKVYSFDMDVIFQTLYELCTNEKVKAHIKTMWNEKDTAFDGEYVQDALSNAAPTVDVEDNFYNFPITTILKNLFQASKEEGHKQILKKMNTTADSIFLDTVLPVEGTVQEKAPAAPPARKTPVAQQTAGVSQEKIQELAALIEKNITLIQEEENRLASTGDTSSAGQPSAGGCTSISLKERDAVASGVEATSEFIQRMASYNTRIMEALSFQDLSGQRIFRIVRLMTDVQVQLLSLLVSFGAKLKKKLEKKEIRSAKEAEKLAQVEVDKMLEKVSVPAPMDGPSAAGRLDQDTVDKMLADLGF